MAVWAAIFQRQLLLHLAVAAVAAFAVAWQKPPTAGHFLTPTELKGITSVACLEAKQKDPAVRCANNTQSEPEMISAFGGQITSANYPNYRNPMCSSHGEFLCDPMSSAALQEKGRQQLAEELTRFRSRHGVECGRLLNDPVDHRHVQPFYLGVAFVPKWPTSDLNPESLQNLGQLIASDWNMDELFVGSPQPYSSSRGGPQVVAKAISALRDHGALEGALAGVREVYDFIGGGERKPEAPPAEATKSWGGTFHITNILQRALFTVAILGLAFSFMLGCVVLLVGPGLLSKGKK